MVVVVGFYLECPILVGHNSLRLSARGFVGSVLTKSSGAQSS